MEAIVGKEITLMSSHNLYLTKSSIGGNLHAEFKNLNM
jgi:hypothetical protein